MPLPKINTEEWKKEVQFYQTSTREQREKRAAELGMLRTSYERRMSERGIKLPRKSVLPINQEPIVIPIPDLKIKPFKVIPKQRDEEDIGIVLADHHVGRETVSYNPSVYRSRMEYLLDSAMTIINLHRPIRDAHLFFVGDIAHGESVYKGAHIEECKTGVYGQIYDIALPVLSSFILSLSQGVSKVYLYGVRGNHGRYDKTAVPRTNWDNFLYNAISSTLEKQKNIIANFSTEFYQLITIRGFRFFIIHGDQVKSSQGIPLFALRRRFQEYYAHVGGFHYAYCGHWHSGGKDQVNSLADYTICPPLVTGDEWALEVIGRASKPIQLAFGVHDTYGRTWEYHLHTDRDFLPQPCK